MAATTPSQLDQALADAATQIQNILSALQGGASTGSLNATDIQQLQTAAVALSADIMQAGPAVAALEQQLLACQQQPQPAPQPSPTPTPANAALMVDAKVAALVALGALVLGGAGGYLLKGSGILGGEGKSRKRHNPLAVTEAARRRRLPTHSKPKQLPRKS